MHQENKFSPFLEYLGNYRKIRTLNTFFQFISSTNHVQKSNKKKIKKFRQSLLVLELKKKQKEKTNKQAKRPRLPIDADFVGVKQLHCRSFNFKYNFWSNWVGINQGMHLYSETLRIS